MPASGICQFPIPSHLFIFLLYRFQISQIFYRFKTFPAIFVYLLVRFSFHNSKIDLMQDNFFHQFINSSRLSHCFDQNIIDCSSTSGSRRFLAALFHFSRIPHGFGAAFQRFHLSHNFLKRRSYSHTFFVYPSPVQLSSKQSNPYDE